MRTLEEAQSEVARELNVRKRCYGRWIDDGKLSKVEATDRLERLEAAAHYLEQMKEYEDKVVGLRESLQPTKSELDTALHG